MTKRNKEFVVKKERFISITLDVKFIMKLIGLALLLISIWYILQYKHLILYLNTVGKYEYYLFMILVSILTLMISLSIGLWFGNLGKWFKIFILIMVIYFAYLGYMYTGLGIEFRTNFGLLNEPIFESNSEKGLDFFIENLPTLIVLFFISIPFESEK